VSLISSILEEGLGHLGSTIKDAVDPGTVPHCQGPFLPFPESITGAIQVCRTGLLGANVIREGGVCKQLNQSVLGRGLEALLREKGPFPSDDAHSDVTSPNVSFNNFSLADERKVVVTQDAKRSDEPIEVFGAACRISPIVLSNLAESYKACGTASVPVLERKPDQTLDRTYMVPANNLIKNLQDAIKSESAINVKATIARSQDPDRAQEESQFELTGWRKDDQSPPDNVLFQSMEKCSASLPNKDDMWVVQLFGITIGAAAEIAVLGLRQVN
jgi:hypothetical protein